MTTDLSFRTTVTAVLKPLLNENAEIVVTVLCNSPMGMPDQWRVHYFIAPKGLRPREVKHKGVLVKSWNSHGSIGEVVRWVTEHTGLALVDESRSDWWNEGLLFR